MDKEKKKDTQIDHLASIEKDFGLPTGFIKTLFKEPSDWSFVIKLYALLETGTTYFLTNELAKPQLRDILLRMDMCERINIIKALNILDTERRLFLRKFSELRNLIVHDIKNINFKFDRYLKGLDKNQRREFCKTFSIGLKSEIKIGEKKIPRESVAKANPRIALIFSTMYLLGEFYYQKQLITVNAERRRLLQKLGEDFTRIDLKKKNQ